MYLKHSSSYALKLGLSLLPRLVPRKGIIRIHHEAHPNARTSHIHGWGWGRCGFTRLHTAVVSLPKSDPHTLCIEARLWKAKPCLSGVVHSLGGVRASPSHTSYASSKRVLWKHAGLRMRRRPQTRKYYIPKMATYKPSEEWKTHERIQCRTN